MSSLYAFAMLQGIGRGQTRRSRSADFFFLFFPQKATLKRSRFADVKGIRDRVTVILNMIPKKAFSDSFQKLYERR